VGTLGNRKAVPLRQPVLVPKVPVVEYVAVVERELLREQFSQEGSVLSALGRVHQVRHHHRYLGLIASEAAQSLILVHEDQLGAGRVNQDLVDHVVGAAGVPNREKHSGEKANEGDREHDWVTRVKGILFNHVGPEGQRNQEPCVEQRHRVVLLSVVVQ